jgi:hypothetical protein
VHEQLLARSDDVAQSALAGATERVASFRYVGQGHFTAADVLLAASAAARARESRRLAREELCASLAGREVEKGGGVDGSSAAGARERAG